MPTVNALKGFKVDNVVYRIDSEALVNVPTIPTPSASDNGKFLRVNSSGNYELGNLPYTFAEGEEF